MKTYLPHIHLPSSYIPTPWTVRCITDVVPSLALHSQFITSIGRGNGCCGGGGAQANKRPSLENTQVFILFLTRVWLKYPFLD